MSSGRVTWTTSTTWIKILKPGGCGHISCSALQFSSSLQRSQSLTVEKKIANDGEGEEVEIKEDNFEEYGAVRKKSVEILIVDPALSSLIERAHLL